MTIILNTMLDHGQTPEIRRNTWFPTFSLMMPVRLRLVLTVVSIDVVSELLTAEDG